MTGEPCLTPGETQGPSAQWGNARVAPGGLTLTQKSLRKFKSLTFISGITLAPATPCEMPMGEEDTMGSAESPLDVPTAQQPSDVPATRASPCASSFQKKKRQVTSVDIYSPTQHDGRCRKMLV